MTALAIGFFYLCEEVSFLRAQQADPTLTRVRLKGPAYEPLANWLIPSLFALTAGNWLFLFVLGRAHGRSFWAGSKVPWGPVRPLDRRTRIIAVVGGLTFIGLGIGLLVSAIKVLVWKSEWSFAHVFFLFFLGYGLALLRIVIRDYRLVHYGLPGAPSRQLTPEQLESIRRALEETGLNAAVKHYREAFPDAGFLEANLFVVSLAKHLKIRPKLADLLRRNQIVWAASILIEVLLAVSILATREWAIYRAAGAIPVLSYVAFGFSAICLALCVIVPRAVMTAMRKKIIKLGQAEGEDSFWPLLEACNGLRLVGQAFLMLLTIILLGAGQWFCLAGAALFLLLQIVQCPTRKRVEAWIEKQQRLLADAKSAIHVV